MRKQLIAAGVAALLAIGGIVVLVAYANGADDRALKGTKTVEVMQVVKQVPKGTAASDLGDSVALKKLPRSAVADGSISNINDVDGLVTSAALQPGEQLLSSRFAKKGSAADSSLPKGFQEVTVPLTRARLVGASIAAGDRVGIIASFEPKGNVPQISAMALNQAPDAPRSTRHHSKPCWTRTSPARSRSPSRRWTPRRSSTAPSGESSG